MYQFLKIYIYVKNNTNTYTYKRKNTEKYMNEMWMYWNEMNNAESQR